MAEQETIEHTKRAVSAGQVPPQILERMTARDNQKLVNEILQAPGMSLEEKYWQIILGTRYGQNGLKKESVTGKKYLPLYVKEKETQGISADWVWLALYQRFMHGTDGAHVETDFAAGLAERFVNSTDAAFLQDVAEILIHDKQLVAASNLLYRLYQIYAQGTDTIRKDKNTAEQWLVLSLRTAANVERKKELAVIYIRQYKQNTQEPVEAYCLRRMAEEEILGGAHDYASYLESIRQYSLAVRWYAAAGEYPARPGLIEAFAEMYRSQGDLVHATWWYLRGGQYAKAYALVDVWDAAAIEAVLPVWQQWHGEADAYTRSLLYIREHHAGIGKLRAVQKQPSILVSTAGFILLNVIFAGMELLSLKNKWILLWAAFLTVGGWLGWDLGRCDIPVWFCSVWGGCMAAHNVALGRMSYVACRQWEALRSGENIVWHPAFDSLTGKFSDSARYAASHQDTRQWGFCLIVIFAVLVSVLAGKYPQGPSIHWPVSPSASSVEQTKPEEIPAQAAEQDRKPQADTDANAAVESTVTTESVNTPQSAVPNEGAIQESNRQVISIFNRYRQAVNGDHFSTAWDYLSPNLQVAAGGYDQWKAGWGKNTTIMASNLEILSNDMKTAVLSCHLTISSWVNNQKQVQESQGQFTFGHGEKGREIDGMMY